MKNLLFALALAAPLAGCATAQGAPVEYVWTRTPGVVFVVVHPTKQELKTYPVLADGSSGNPVDPRAQYLLLCDARRGDGMHCDMATEAAVRRASYTPGPAASGPALDVPVGSISDVIETRTSEATAPPPAPPPPSPPPPPPPPTPPTGGKK